jgi:hypothetical protein
MPSIEDEGFTQSRCKPCILQSFLRDNCRHIRHHFGQLALRRG